ncbi:MAG: PHP domain-containing protein, partial [bacterium]
MNYIPLHVHSMFSLLDGLSKPEQIAERCNEIGASACALTDHGNIAGAIKFYSAMKNAG